VLTFLGEPKSKSSVKVGYDSRLEKIKSTRSKKNLNESRSIVVRQQCTQKNFSLLSLLDFVKSCSLLICIYQQQGEKAITRLFEKALAAGSLRMATIVLKTLMKPGFGFFQEGLKQMRLNQTLPLRSCAEKTHELYHATNSGCHVTQTRHIAVDFTRHVRPHGQPVVSAGKRGVTCVST